MRAGYSRALACTAALIAIAAIGTTGASGKPTPAPGYKLAGLQYPGKFGVFYDVDRPTKNTLEYKWIESTQSKMGGMTARQVLQKRFDMMK